MSVMQQALQEVGYTRRKDMWRHNVEKFNLVERFERQIDKAIKPMEKKIEVRRCGSHYTARYRGERNFFFGETPEQAISRLAGKERLT